jgi:hypothetical protein
MAPPSPLPPDKAEAWVGQGTQGKLVPRDTVSSPPAQVPATNRLPEPAPGEATARPEGYILTSLAISSLVKILQYFCFISSLSAWHPPPSVLLYIDNIDNERSGLTAWVY